MYILPSGPVHSFAMDHVQLLVLNNVDSWAVGHVYGEQCVLLFNRPCVFLGSGQSVLLKSRPCILALWIMLIFGG